MYSSSSSNSSSGNIDSEVRDTPNYFTSLDWGRGWVGGDVDGHPYLALGVGLSKSCGEFVRVKWTTGGTCGLLLSGSMGKDWIFKEEYANKLSWNVGAGLRISNANNDFEWNLLVGRTPWHPDVALMMNLEYEHFFGDAKRFGVFGNIGFAGTNLEHPKGEKAKAYFDFMAGFAVKLWQR